MEKLDFKEKIKLERYKERILNLIFKCSGGTFDVLLIVSFIPMGLIPTKRIRTISNPDLSIFESMGIMPTLLMLLIISGSICLYLYFSFKYAKLSKDVIEQKKVTLDVKVRNVIYKQGQGPQEIDLFFSPPYGSVNKVQFIGEDEFPRLQIDQEVKLVLTKNALYPLSIEPKSDIKDILAALNNIIKNQK